MTKIAFANKMTIIAHRYEDDEEVAHIKADELMCQVLNELGYGKGIKVFEDMKKWYA